MKVKEESEKVGLKLNIQKTKIMASGPITSWEIDGAVETVSDFIFSGSKITADGDCSLEIKRWLFLGRKVMTNLDSILKSRDITLPTKVRLISYGFSSNHVWMWELDYKESWAPKNWCFWTVVLEKTFESPLDCKEIQTVHPKGNQSWIFIGRTDTEAEIPFCGLLIWRTDSGKGPDAGKDWRQGQKRTIEHKMIRWLQQLDGHEIEQAPGVGDGQESLACCSPWGRKESDTIERLKWTEPNIHSLNHDIFMSWNHLEQIILRDPFSMYHCYQV